jgi:gas vesicle protein
MRLSHQQEVGMRFILGLIIGIAVGAAVGLIVAPQSGKATREALSTRMQRDGQETEEAVSTG